MNIAEGMRRIGIVLGFIGATAGAFVGYQVAHDTWSKRSVYDRFQSLVASPLIEKDRRDLLDEVHNSWFYGAIPKEDKKRLAVLDESGHEGIDQVTINPAIGLVTSVKLSTGEVLTNAAPPGRINYLSIVLFPIIGFVIPWCSIRVLTWIGSGFSGTTL